MMSPDDEVCDVEPTAENTWNREHEVRRGTEAHLKLHC